MMKTSLLIPLAIISLNGYLQGTPPPWTPPTIQPGVSAFTCISVSNNPGDAVFAMADLRDPLGCAAPPIPSNWTAATSSPRKYFQTGWDLGTMGEVFGVDVGSGNNSDIYVAALGPKPVVLPWTYPSRQWKTAPLGSGGDVLKVNGITGAVSLLASLPNHKAKFIGACGYCLQDDSFVGLGNLSFSKRHNKVYVTNLDDGLIYAIDATSGATLCTFDHGTMKPGTPVPDDPTLLYTQRNRMVFGIEYHTNSDRVFYALRNPLDQDEIWSAALDASGCFVSAQPCLEYISPPTPTTLSLPADIQFSPDGGRMLISYLTVTFEDHNITNTTPAITGQPLVQKVPLRSAHNARTYECTRSPSATCGGWTYMDFYRSGTVYSLANSVGSDYGFGDLNSVLAADSVVMMAETLQPGGYGIQINPLGDYTRANVPANFDVRLGTQKTTFNDVDVLHTSACMALTTAAIKCPTSAGGPYTLNLTVTNLSPDPIVSMNLTACQPNQLPPGSATVTPSSPGLQNILMPGASATVPVTLPGLPLSGGKVCFCVTLFNEAGQPPCQDIVCVNLPNCVTPCMTLASSNIQCVASPNGGFVYTMSLSVTNQQPTPANAILLFPCPANQLPANASNSTPSPASVVLGSPLLNGGSTTVPVTLPGLPSTGGKFCFCVEMKTALEGQPLCRDKICFDLPPCPDPCIVLGSEKVTCPQTSTGSYSLMLQITNLSSLPADAYVLSPCASSALPAGAITTSPLPAGIQIFGSPLLPSMSTTIPVTLPGLPFTGATVCFNVSLLNASSDPGGGPELILHPLCDGKTCVQLPECVFGPCSKLDITNITCPKDMGGAYGFNLSITNLQTAVASQAALLPCNANELPSGSATTQPNPVGIFPLAPPLVQNGTTTIPVTLPSVPLTGGKICFCVVLLGQDEQEILCRQIVCVDLPACTCAQVLDTHVVCLPDGSYQLSATVLNNTSLFGTPYNFGLATFTPFFAFSPNPSVPSPNPITPGGSGTFTTIYNGQPGPKCFSVIFSNSARTRCCPQSICFDLPPCEPVVPDRCTLKSTFVCASNGPTPVTFYITNSSASNQSYQWTITPVAMAGCTGSLPANSFSPPSGTTPAVGPGGSQGVALNVNTASLTPGQCAGFEICFTRKNDPVTKPICCRAVVQCPGLGTPCVIIYDALTRMFPGGAIGIPIEIKNPTDSTMDVDLVFSDSEGLLAFSIGDADPAIDMPLKLTLAPLESVTYLVLASEIGTGDLARVAIGSIVVGPPCVFFPDKTDRYASALLFYSLQPPADPALGNPLPLAVDESRWVTDGGDRFFQFELSSPAGSTIQLFKTDDLTAGSDSLRRLLPAIDGLVINPDGSFFGDGSVRTINIPTIPGKRREFYFLQDISATPLDPQPPLEIRE